MPREDKPLQLKPIDDDALDQEPVIRLKNQESKHREPEEKPIVLSIEGVESSSRNREDQSTRGANSLRTHQPGIDALIESELANKDLLEQNWGEQTTRRHPIPWGWFALIGLLLLGAAAWSLSRLEKSEIVADQIRIETESTLDTEEQDEREARLLIDRIEATLHSFFATTTVESLAEKIRHPQRVTPLAQEYYKTNPLLSGPIKTLKSLQPLTMQNRGNFWMVTFILNDNKRRNLILEVTESGEPLIDWETLVCHQPMPWDEFATQRPRAKPMDFRVYAQIDNLYSHEFNDSKEWLCLRLTTRDSEEILYGYLPAASPEAKMLLKTPELRSGRRASLILRLLIPEDLQSRRGVVIEKVLNNRWIYLDPPDSGA